MNGSKRKEALFDFRAGDRVVEAIVTEILGNLGVQFVLDDVDWVAGFGGLLALHDRFLACQFDVQVSEPVHVCAHDHLEKQLHFYINVVIQSATGRRTERSDRHSFLESGVGTLQTTELVMGHVSGMRRRVRGYGRRVRAEIDRSFSEEYTPHQVATSFSIGVFITMLPTLGVGLALFVAIAYLSDWINKVSLFASVLVFNPVVKWGVYAGSLALGFFLLGPVEVETGGSVAAEGGQAVLIRLLVGNLILAVVATIAGYVVVYRLARRYRERAFALVDTVLEDGHEPLERAPPGDRL